MGIATAEPDHPSKAALPNGYSQVLTAAKHAVRAARTQVALAANAELIRLYWTLGRLILDRMDAAGWGAKVVERLSADLRAEFPDMTGFSPRNLRYMRAMAAAWPDEAMLLRVIATLPWGHIQELLNALDDRETRDWYAREAVANGWTRAVLANQIASTLHLRVGAAVSNFSTALPPTRAEREVEHGLIAQLARTLQELGVGFYYAGRQHRLVIAGDDGEELEYFLDLLFYHHHLRRFVVLELKIDSFKPECAGKLDFYCNVVDDQLRHQDGRDEPTIGILLCASRSKTVVDYALRNLDTPMAVATYTYHELPPELQRSLPSPADLESLAAGALARASAFERPA